MPEEMVSHKQFEALSGPRTRVRLTQRGWLPQVPWIRADRARLGIYPRFLLAALVPSGRPSGLEDQILRKAAQVSEELYRDESFGLLSRRLAEAMRSHPGLNWPEVSLRLPEDARQAISHWSARIEAVERDLRGDGLSVESAPARVTGIDRTRGRYEVELDGALRELQGFDVTAVEVTIGGMLWKQTVRVGSGTRDFLFPAGGSPPRVGEGVPKRKVVVTEPEYRLLDTGQAAVASRVLAAVAIGKARLEKPPRFVGDPDERAWSGEAA